MYIKHLVRAPIFLVFTALVALLTLLALTPSAGFAQATPSDTAALDDHSGPSPSPKESSASPAEPPTPTEPPAKATESDPPTAPKESGAEVDVTVELYDTAESLLDNAVISADQDLLVSATIHDAGLTQLLNENQDLEDEPAIEVELELPTGKTTTVTYDFGELEPRFDEDNRPLADTYWMNPEGIDSDDIVDALPEDANGLITATASYDRHGHLEDPVTIEEPLAFLDTTAPVIESLTYGTPDESHHDVVLDDYLVADGARALELTVVDESTADNLELDPETVDDLHKRFSNLWQVTDVTATHKGEPLEVQTITAGETYRIVLDEAREYHLDELSIKTTDTADNSNTYNAQHSNTELNDAQHQVPSTLAIDLPESEWFTRVLAADGTKEHSGEDLLIRHETPGIILESDKPYFPRLMAHVAEHSGDEPKLSFEHSYGNHRVGLDVTCDDTALEPNEEGIYRVTCTLPTHADENVLDGAYRLAESPVAGHKDVQWSQMTGHLETLAFTLDTTAPEVFITATPDPQDHKTIPKLGEEHTSYEDYRDHALLIGRGGKSVEYGIALYDIYPADHPGHPSDPTRSQRGTAGLDEETVEVHLPAPTNLQGDSLGRATTLHPEVDSDGEITIELTAEGIYDLSAIKISAQDQAGNTLEAAALSSALDEGEPQLIAVMPAKSHATADLRITSAEGEPAAAGPSMFRGDVDLTFVIKDRWFPLYRALTNDFDTLLTLQYSYTLDPEEHHIADLNLDPDKFQPGENNTWIYTDLELPQAQGKPVEARYEMSWDYSGLNPLAGKDRTTGHETFWVDYTSPVITDAQALITEELRIVETLADELIGYETYTGEPLLVSPNGESVRYRLNIKDLFPDEHPAYNSPTGNAHSHPGTTGLDETSVQFKVPNRTDLHGEHLGRGETTHPGVTENGTFWIELSAEGLYDLSQVEIRASDQAGNKLEPVSLYDVIQNNESPHHKFVVVNRGESPTAVDLQINRAEGVADATDNSKYFRGDVDITFSVQDRWFPLYHALRNDLDSLLTMQHRYTNDEAISTYLELRADDFIPAENNTWVYTDIELPTASYRNKPLEAHYEFAWLYSGLDPSDETQITGKKSFWIDYTAPIITETTPEIEEQFWFVDSLPDQHLALDSYAGEPLLISPHGDTVRYRVNVQDLFPEGHPAADRLPDNASAHTGTSGLHEVKYSLPKRTDLQNETLGKAQSVTPEVNTDGTFWIELSGEGLYDLSQVMISATDNAGNEIAQISLYDSFQDAPDHRFVVVNRDESPVAADLSVTKADDVPASTDSSYYYRGDIDTQLTVTDRWFPIYLAHPEHREKLVTLKYDTSPAASEPFNRADIALDPDKFVASDEYEWVYRDIELPRAANSAKPLEAHYDLAWDYAGLNTEHTHAGVSGQHEFIVDYTGPQLGELQFSDLTDIQDDWIVADSAYTVTLLGVNDAIAGVDADSVGFHRFKDQDWRDPVSRVGFDPGVSDLEEDPRPAPKFKGDNHYAGKVSFDMTGDSQRLFLDRTVIGLTDKAGNPVDTGLLNRYEPTQLELRLNQDDIYEGPRAIVIASADPALAVTYDHDNARNGHYYKTERTGTVTVTDANFDLLQELDGHATVMTAAVDDSERTLPAEDFANPSGDRQTWVANLEFSTDGDWDIEAQATTISGKTSKTFTDAWTLDTLDPMITADFDPEVGEAGQYFNTVRTVTLNINERNFSPDDTSVAVSAQTADGDAAPAPSGSGWVEVDEYEWVQTITFADELVYEVSVDTVDLAGNTTDTYEVPEFIVDLTAPELEISQVQDATAYAGVVAPEVEVVDTYLSPGEVEYVLEGFNQGTVDSSTHFVTEDFDETTWSAIWEDFPREIAIDDVYTLSVSATDMAGNTTSDAVTFSVNRFGSTYMFSDGTSNLRGQYLKEPIDVEITEINVSGLNADSTEVSVVENDRVRALEAEDFSLEDASVDGGWQAMHYTLPAELFDASAYFRIMLSSVDEAGNLSQNTMDNKGADRESSADVKFAVDQVAPNVTLGDIEAGEVYYSPVKNLIPDAKDNLALESVSMTVDGHTVLEASGTEALSEILAHQLPADAQEHTIVVSATDKAGNVSKATYADVLVAANFWQHLRSQPLLAAALVAGGLVLLAALTLGTIAVIRRRRRLAYRRNPFGL